MAEQGRVLSFGAGPGLWPDEVLERVGDGFRPQAASGLSVLELSHRGPVYSELHEKALEQVRTLLGVGTEHEVLLLPGGASMQFALAPANLLPAEGSADYLLTGKWSLKARSYAAEWGKVKVAASSEDKKFAEVPLREQWTLDPAAAYLHVTTNNTIAGTQLAEIPANLPSPLVVDASSDILTRELPLDRIGLLYAGAQKNLGPAGLGVVVIRKDLLERKVRSLPGMLCYRDHAAQGSRQNTPPTALVYLLSLMLEWVEGQGGVEEMCRRADERASIVYGALDAHPEVYEPHAAPGSRSKTNVVFRLEDPARESEFLEAATQRRMAGLKGHRSVGGLRASLYAPMPVDGARRLAELIVEFAEEKGSAREL